MSIPSLSDMCLEIMLTSPKFKTLESLLTIYTKIDSSNPSFQPIRAYVMKLLSERYPMLLDKYGHNEMSLIFSPEDLEQFDAELNRAMEIKKRFSSLKGTVLDPVSSHVEQKRLQDGCYPLSALLQGAAWPNDVDPSRREQYLSDSEFLSVFKMSKAEFNEKDKFVRLRLKKQHNLF